MFRNALAVLAAAALLLASAMPGYSESLEFRFNSCEAQFKGTAKTSDVKAAGSRISIEKIVMPGFSSCASSGNPALPCKLMYLAIPPGADVSTVKVALDSYSTNVLPGTYDISPAPEAAVSDGDFHSRPREIRCLATYGTDAFYPREHLRVRCVERCVNGKSR